jgi:cytochrome c-type biogenesis protein CcmH/NrfG
MLEWGFWLGFILLGCLGIGVAVYPLRRKKKLLLLVLPASAVFLIIFYILWGGSAAWQDFRLAQQKQGEAKRVIESLGSVDKVIERLKTSVSENPKDAKAWFLLGRVYASSGRLDDAKQAYEVARGLAPKMHTYTLHYAESVWALNQQSFDDKTRGLLEQILKEDPKQPDALAMLAYDAYSNKQHKKAIMYWERLLELIDPSTEEAAKIRQAIVKARDR